MKDRIFAGWGKSKERLDKKSGVSEWTLHDLRRTYATIQAQLGTPPHVIEALLNHKSGIISGVAQTYNRYHYLAEMKAAVSNFDAHFQATVLQDAT
jgi:integrase